MIHKGFKGLDINITEENNLQSIKFKCEYCGHTNTLPAYIDNKICGWCKHKIYNKSKAHFNRTILMLLQENK